MEYTPVASKRGLKADIKIMSLKDKFLEKYGTQQELLDYSGLSFKDLSKTMKNFIKR